jgi:hypothetical protein
MALQGKEYSCTMMPASQSAIASGHQTSNLMWSEWPVEVCWLERLFHFVRVHGQTVVGKVGIDHYTEIYDADRETG